VYYERPAFRAPDQSLLGRSGGTAVAASDVAVARIQPSE